MNIRFTVAMMLVVLLSFTVVSCSPKAERVNKPSATSTAMITPEEIPPVQEAPPVKEEPSVESSPDGVYNDRSEYSDVAYADFLEDMNGIIKKSIDETNAKWSEKGKKLGIKDVSANDIKFSWGENGKHDTLILSAKDLPMPKDYCIKLAALIADIYHIKFPNNVSLKFIIKDPYMKSPIYQNIYTWGDSA